MTLNLDTVYLGDCLEVMKDIPDGSVDMILCDLPYGISHCKWDAIIPFEPLWEQYKRIIKDNRAIVLFGSEPFGSALRMSNIKQYKYDWYYRKTGENHGCNFAHAKNMPLKNVETISVFSQGMIAHKGKSQSRMVYNPQGLVPYGKLVRGNMKGGINNEHRINCPSNKEVILQEYTNYPYAYMEFANDNPRQHPTQKPIALLEYLIRTYTNEGDMVLDNCMGSGSTCIAAINTNRHYIGIEKEQRYFDIAQERIYQIKEQYMSEL